MSGLERAELMDNQRTAMMRETYDKEKKIQRDFFKKQEAEGKVVGKPPEPAQTGKSALEIVGVPEHVKTVKMDPELSVHTTMSRNMWKANPGYLIRDGPRMASSMKQDYTYDAEEVEYMKSMGMMDKKHNRLRDEFVNFVEAAARQKDMGKMH